MGRLGAAGEVGPAARRTLLRGVVAPSWAIILLLTVPFAAGLEIPQRLGWVQYAPFAASLLLFGLPHGATDHLVPGRLTGRGADAGSVAAVVALYLALGGAYLALWTVSPFVSFALFVLVTWFHWGQGDVYSSRELLGAGVPTALGLAVRGGLPMLVPLLAFPEVYSGVGESLVGLFGGTYPEAAPGGGYLALRIIGVLAALGAAGLYLAAVYRRSGGGRSFVGEAGEVALLAAFFATVPPVLAVGVYFCLWHSTRHIARLVLLDPPAAASLERGEGGSLPVAFGRFARDAAPLTLAALGLLVLLYLYVSAGPTGPGGAGEVGEADGLLAGYLVLISALTLPHVVLVTWMDLRQGV